MPLGDSALHLAVRSKDSVSIATLLIKNGSDINAVDKFGLTPLEVAIDRGIPFKWWYQNLKLNKGLIEILSHLLGLFIISGNEVGVELLIKSGALIPTGAIINAAKKGSKLILFVEK